jgi:hypothetical protein
MVCVSGQYTVVLNDEEFVLNLGDELLIPNGTEHLGKCIAGTRTIHAFGENGLRELKNDKSAKRQFGKYSFEKTKFTQKNSPNPETLRY